MRWRCRPGPADVVPQGRPLESRRPLRWARTSRPEAVTWRRNPRSSTAGTSRIEQDFLAAAQSHDPDATSTRIGRWKVDVLVQSVRLVIEYDGVYWHRDKQEIDARKTVDLIQSGFWSPAFARTIWATSTWTTRTCDSCRSVPTSGASTTSWRGFP